MGMKEGRGNLNAFKMYLDELRALQINWDPWRVDGPEPEYLARSRAVTAIRVLLESAFGWQWEIQSQARGAAEERRAAGERQRGGEGHVRQSLSGPVRGGPPKMLWKIAVLGTQGNPTEIHLVPARVPPTPLTVPVPNEWVNGAVRDMLAMENVIKRAASGIPLELHYPAPTPPPAQRAPV
ncbi:hypothetical protein RHMOL_Rhmol11G0026400 [Rhododendron molle]|uniref:Uncharacterized protein n=1 Tax=Rhododendron molle TaxID=49168 RepID=A0ACC0LN72_RHOML|nr:hypothetical protein RHMOL_Rhmol11G0026400 [Rhododendron molle]